MNIECTGRLYDAAKMRRFAGKVYDRIARAAWIMIYAFIAVCLLFEALAYLCGRYLDYYLLFILALLFFIQKFVQDQRIQCCRKGDEKTRTGSY